jgi:hypothetical protein
MQPKDWITLVIALLSLVAGSGWGKYWLERRHDRRLAERAVLSEFLRPLESILKQSKRVHDALAQDELFDRLEYAADNLQQHFASLPDGDSVKLSWSALIDGLMEGNRHAVKLIQDNAGSILSDDFRSACDDFVDHAARWEALWRATLGKSEVPSSMWGAGQLLAPPFPESMDALLAKEIEERCRRAGV